jgi:hypothetical protein
MESIQPVPGPPAPGKTYSEDDGHEHEWGHEYPYSNRQKYHQCTKRGCSATEVWKV